MFRLPLFTAARSGSAIALAAAIAAAGCARNPATGQNQLMLVSESQEIQMGQQYDTQVVATIGLYPDARLQNYIQELGTRLAAGSERPSLPWTFRVVNDPAVNAFALPGGFIYVTRGILPYLNSEAQLASIVGHEIGHVTARHTAAEMSKQQIAGLGLAIGSIASPSVARYAGAASQALGVLFLKYSRDNESQADQLGLRYMTRASYDPHEMPAIFVMLDREGKAASNGSRLPTWLETHPSPANRLEAINKQIAALPPNVATGTTVNRDSYIQRLNGVIFGINPREGFFAGNRFFEPELRFQLTFPQGWATNNGAQAVMAMSPQQDATIELSQAHERNADAAANAFLSQQGIAGAALSRGNLNGLSAVSSPFAATTSNGTLRGTVMFVEQDGAVYRLLGYAPDAKWSAYQATINQSLRSYQRLTDPALLGVQPQKLEVMPLDRRTTIAELVRQRQSPATPETLALLNQVEVQTPLQPGTLVKWVVGQPLPLP